MKKLAIILKPLSAAMLLMFFVGAISVSGCTTKSTESDNTDAVEEATEESSEHPSGNEHPTGGNETETDSTSVETGGSEHPSGDDASEHPSN